MTSILYIAAAGAGKTTKIVNDAISNKDEKSLMLTYTNVNESEINKKVKKITGTIPHNIKIQTWFSFLLKEGIRPYQGEFFNKRIENIIFISGQKRTNKEKTSPEYYSKNNKIYTDKLSECVIYLDDIERGMVINRISRIYNTIYIDEIQDLVGYDLEIIKRLIGAGTKLVMAGDPRQCTYTTHSNKKYIKYNNGKINEFFKNECPELKVIIDNKSLNISHRNSFGICKLANLLFSDRPPIEYSAEKTDNEHSGVYIVKEEHIEYYLETYQATQLRHNKKRDVNANYEVLNFGESKGIERDRVLIYPTKPIWKWLTKREPLADKSRSSFYVALTRARYSVGIVRLDHSNIQDVDEYEPNI